MLVNKWLLGRLIIKCCLLAEDLEKGSNSGSNNNDSWTEENVEESSSDEEPDFNVVDSPGGKTKMWQPIVPKE
ncbi:hypothetical protein L1887_38286 [Cichorium endivia]|nr:hypothetical protein L1887_38286 [Cichorium endivia]